MARVIIRILGALNLLSGIALVITSGDILFGALGISIGIGFLTLSRWGLNLYIVVLVLEIILGLVQHARSFDAQAFTIFLIVVAIRILLGLYLWRNRSLFTGRFNKFV